MWRDMRGDHNIRKSPSLNSSKIFHMKKENYINRLQKGNWSAFPALILSCATYIPPNDAVTHVSGITQEEVGRALTSCVHRILNSESAVAAMANPVQQISIFVRSFVRSFGLSNQSRSMKCHAQNDRLEKVSAASIIGGKIPNLPLVFFPAGRLVGQVFIVIVAAKGTVANTEFKSNLQKSQNCPTWTINPSKISSYGRRMSFKYGPCSSYPPPPSLSESLLSSPFVGDDVEGTPTHPRRISPNTLKGKSHSPIHVVYQDWRSIM